MTHTRQKGINTDYNTVQQYESCVIDKRTYMLSEGSHTCSPDDRIGFFRLSKPNTADKLSLFKNLVLGTNSLSAADFPSFSRSIHFQISSKISFLWAMKLPHHTSQYLSQIIMWMLCVSVCMCARMED